MDPTVLIVEDEAAIVTMLRYNLEREGMQVVEAGDGDEALKILAETHVERFAARSAGNRKAAICR